MMDLFITNKQLFISQDINWWNGVVWIACGLFLFFFSQLFGHSIWRHPFTADDPLMSNDVKLKGWVHFQQIFMFVWSTVFLNCKLVSWIIQMCHMWCSCSYYFLRVCLHLHLHLVIWQTLLSKATYNWGVHKAIHLEEAIRQRKCS